MTWFLYLLLTIGMTLGQHENQHKIRLEDIENENVISERRSSSDYNYAKSNSVSFTTSKPISPQLQFGFTPIKEYFTSPTESPNPSVNDLQNYQNQGQVSFNNYQPQAAQQYQTQFYQQPQQTHQYQTQPQQNYQYETQQPQNLNLQESRPVEYLQPQAQALQSPQVIYQSETGKADQYAQVVPQYSTLPQQYQSVAPVALQSDKPSQVIQQNQQQYSQYSTFPQQQQGIQTYQNEQSSKSPAFQQNQQLPQYSTLPQGKVTSQTAPPSKAVQYQQEVLQYQDSVGSLQKTGSSNQVQLQDTTSLRYLQPQLQGLEGVSYFGNGQVGSDFLNSFQDVFSHNLFYQPQTSASTAINSYVQPHGPLQYFTYIPANVIENSPKGGFVQSGGNGAHVKVISQSPAFMENTKAHYDFPSIRQPTSSKKYAKYTNVAHPQKSSQKLINSAKNHARFQNPQNVPSRRPTSLLDSYVPSAVQLQYFKDLQLKQQQEQQLHQLQSQESSHELNENLQPPSQNDQHIKSASHKRSPYAKRSNYPRV